MEAREATFVESSSRDLQARLAALASRPGPERLEIREATFVEVWYLIFADNIASGASFR